MNRNFTKMILVPVLLLFSIGGYAQTTISGNVSDESGEGLIGVNVLVEGTVLGTITELNGDFSLTVQSAPPFTLVVSYVGYETQRFEITSSTNDINVQLLESTLLGQEVVVSASRVEESILQSPVSIEKMDILAVQNASADTYYKAIANLKGVDVATSSINFQILNTRGFASTGNTRFVQLIDGMDTQAPALNFPIGNLNGPSVLDVESVELLPGASSALYGPNAFNGVLLVNSKNPFDYQGLSAYVKTGVNHVSSDADQDAALLNTFSVRYAKAFNNKFAFKLNATYSYADDWHGTSDFDRNEANNPFASIGGDNPGADRLHFHGDEAAINLAIFPLSGDFNALAGGRAFGPGVSARTYSDAGDLPNHVVSVTPFREADIVDYGSENLKLNAGLYYRLNDKLELSYLFNSGAGTSIYTGAQRYSLSNFGIQQHRLQLRSDNFFLRSYVTAEDSGDSYIAEFLALRMNTIRTDGVNGSITRWLANYGVNYIDYLNQQGFQPGEFGALMRNQETMAQALPISLAAHTYAREQTDLLAQPVNPEDNPAQFEANKLRGLEGVVPFGPRFADQTKLYHTEAQYDFKNEIDAFDLQVGGSYRIYDLRSNGTIFPDADGGIQINEFGAFVQAGYNLLDNLKLSGSFRFDKNENFDAQTNPRLSAVWTIAQNHNIRGSIQSGFRFPTTQGQFIDLNIISNRLLGGLQANYDDYGLARLSSNGTDYLSFQAGSVLDFRNNFFATGGFDPSILNTFEESDVKPVVPERVRSIEVGYKSLISNKLLVDAVYYHNTYQDFITQIQVIIAEENPDGTPNYATLLNGSALTLVSPGVTTGNTAQIYSNIEDEVTAQGFALGLTYNLPKGYTIGGNYTWSQLIGGFSNNNLSEFNTPEHKYNINFGNRKVTDNIGFNVTYRWQEAFQWESSFARGPVPSYSTFDAQVSLRLPELKSIVKVGGSNILGETYIQSLGGPNIGPIYYVSLMFDQLMN